MTTSEALLAEMQEHTKLLTSMDKRLATIATAASLFSIMFVLSAIVVLVSVFMRTSGK